MSLNAPCKHKSSGVSRTLSAELLALLADVKHDGVMWALLAQVSMLICARTESQSLLRDRHSAKTLLPISAWVKPDQKS